MRLEARICRMSHMTKTVTTREGAYVRIKISNMPPQRAKGRKLVQWKFLKIKDGTRKRIEGNE